MSNSWSSGGYAFANLDLKAMHGSPGLGFYRLIAQVDMTMHGKDPGKEVTVTNIGGELSVTGKSKTKHFLGYVRRQGVDYPIATIKGISERQLQLEIDLDSRQVQAIEDIRLGGGLQFKLDLYGMAYRGSQSSPSNVSVTLHYHANQSTWTDILERMGYNKTILLEIPFIDSKVNKHFPKAAEYLQIAQKHLLNGHYRDTVGSCRDALEALEKALGDKKEVKSITFEKSKQKTKEERLQLIRRALKTLTHLAKHGDEAAQQIEWGPEDARMVITITAALLQKAAGV